MIVTRPHCIMINSFVCDPFSLYFEMPHENIQLEVNEQDGYDDFVSGYIHISLTSHIYDTDFRYTVSYSIAHSLTKGESDTQHIFGDDELKSYLLSILCKHHAKITKIR